MNSSSDSTSELSLGTAAKAGPGDVFRHLLAIIALYLSAVSFGVVVFSFIARWFPDPLVYPAGASLGPLRWALSTLIIVFPAYIWVSWATARSAVRDPLLRSLRSRRWLYHFTVFAASVVIIGDLVALVFNFLNGDLTARFLLKVAVVLFIALAIFIYYLWNIRREGMASSDPRMRILVFGVIAVVVAVSIYGLVMAGSPFRERERRFDDRRTGDLQNIQWQIVNFWQRKDRLPASLDELRDDISGFISPQDPETGEAYDYRVTGPLAFELCAVFRAEDRVGPAIGPRPLGPEPGTQNWTHGVGRVCFARAIDPDLYSIEKPKR